jgi:outer membrane murein-binding lipoprotein Lpp
MTSKFSLLAGAGMGIALIAGGATPTFAATKKPVHHAKHAAVKSAHNAEIDALRAQVEALTARLDAQEQNTAQTTAQVQAAQSQAAAAQVAAQSAQTEAAAAQTAVPTEVKTQLAANKPKPQWFDSTSITGRMYFDGSNISQKVNGVKTPGSGTGFNIKRLYVGIDHTFSPIFSGNVTMDISNVVGSTSNYNFNANSATAPANSTALVGRGFYVKKAYLQAKLNPALVIRVGAADLPWVPWIENQYGYRHIENTLIDRTNFGTSADWGVHALGDLAGGIISYQVSAIDGGGYRNVKVTKTVDFEGRLSASYKGFFAGIGGYTGKRANNTEGALTSATTTVNGITYIGNTHLHTATREDAALGYKSKLFTLGGEYFHAKNWNNVTTATQDKSKGYSVFGNVNFAPKWSVFGRYDWVKFSEVLNPEFHQHYYNGGIQYEPVKIVDIALVYKHESLLDGSLAAVSGYANQNAPAVTIPINGRATTNEIGIFGQLRF